MAGGTPVSIVPSTQGGIDAASGSGNKTKVVVKAAPGQVYGWFIDNPNDEISYVQFFDALTAGVTVGTTAPKFSIGIPAQGGSNVAWPTGIEFQTGIVIAMTTGRANNTDPTNTVDYNIFYK